MPQPKIAELRTQNQELLTRARAKYDEITDDTDESRAAEIEREHDSIMDQWDKNEATIKRMERIEAAEAAAALADEKREQERREQKRPLDDTDPHKLEQQPEVSRREKANVFRMALLGGPASLNPAERRIFNDISGTPEIPEDAPAEVRALAAGSNAEGGYTVPEMFSGELEKTLAVWGPMMDENVIRLKVTDGGNDIPWPGIDDTASRGESQAENDPATDDAGNDFAFNIRTIKAWMKNSEIMRVPVQLLQDSDFDFENDIIPDLFGERMGRTLNDDLTTGTGTDEAQGIVTGAGAGNTALSQTALLADELIDLQHTVNQAYRRNPKAAFMFSDATYKMIRKLKDGEGRYIFQNPRIDGGTPTELLGKPFYINDSMAAPAAGTVPVVFGDLSKYFVRRVRNTQLFIFRELFMNRLQLGFMAYVRIDGRVLNTAAIKKLTMAT